MLPFMMKPYKYKEQTSVVTVDYTFVDSNNFIKVSRLPLKPLWIRARIFKRLRSPGIDSEESIPPGWESIPGLLKRFTNTGSGC